MNTETARESLHPFFSTGNLRETLAARLPGPASQFRPFCRPRHFGEHTFHISLPYL